MPVFKKKAGLKFKITFMVIMLLLLLMGSVSYLFSAKELNYKRSGILSRMEDIARTIGKIASLEQTDNWNLSQDFIDDMHRVNEDIVYVAVYDNENNLKASMINREAFDVGGGLEIYSQSEIIEMLVTESFSQEAQEDMQKVEVDVNSEEDEFGSTVKIGKVVIGFSMINVNWEITQTYRKSIILFSLFMVIGIAASIFLGSTLSNPLIKISNALMKVSEGDLEQRLEVKTQDEIGTLSKTVNFMIAELQEKQFFENFERELVKFLIPEKISELILKELTENAKVNSGLFTLVGENDTFKTVFCRGFEELNFKNLNNLIIERIHPDEVKNKNVYVLCPEILTDDRFKSFFKDYRFDYMVILIRMKKVFGLIYLRGDKSYKTFEKLKLIENMMSYAVLPFENSLLYENLAEQERMKQELEIARSVQISLLPKTVPEIENIDIHGLCIPAKEVGGDYYDIIKLDNNKYGFVIADVSGKGTSAAFYMAEIKGMINTLSHIYSSPMKLLQVLNKRLFGTIDKKMFATMIYGVLDVKSNEFTFARAGHNSLVYKNTKGISSFLPKGIGVGLEKGTIFNREIEELSVPLRKNDVIFFYTDGISEAMNVKREEFGEDRVHTILSGLNDVSSKSICEIFLNEVRKFAGNAEQNDDLTMIVIKHT